MSVPYKGITLDRTLRLYGNGKLPLSILKEVHCGGTMYGPAAWWFNLMWDDAKKAGITLKATGRGYRPYGSQEAMFLDRYSRTPTLRKPVVTRKWKGHKASHDDIYEEKRKELKRLREELEIPNHAQQKPRRRENLQ